MKVAGIEIEKVNEGVLNAALQAAELPTTGALGTRVRRYAEHVKQTVPAGSVAECTTCGGSSAVQAPCCPYCGDGELEGEAAAVATTPAPVDPPAPEPPPVAPEPPAPPVSRRMKASKQPKAAPPPVAPAEEAPALEASQAPQAPLVAPEEPASVPTPDPTPEEPPQASLQAPGVVALEQEAMLDEFVQRVQRLKERAAVSIWELGNALHQAHQSGIWQARTKPNGQRRYLAWGDFTEHELGISQGYAHRLMHVAVQYTSEQVERLGAHKLYITLQVPKESRAALLEAAEQGATRQKLGEMADEIGRQPVDVLAESEGDTDDSDDNTDDAAPASSKRRHGGTRDGAGRPVSKVTVSALLKRVEIPLHCGSSKKRPARSLDDNPQATERMINGVLQQYFITKNPDGTLVLVVDRKREQR